SLSINESLKPAEGERGGCGPKRQQAELRIYEQTWLVRLLLCGNHWVFGVHYISCRALLGQIYKDTLVDGSSSKYFGYLWIFIGSRLSHSSCNRTRGLCQEVKDFSRAHRLLSLLCGIGHMGHWHVRAWIKGLANTSLSTDYWNYGVLSYKEE
ncbi:hypothetical protein Tco_0022042, partial [Tanacetum coccineum]